MKSQKLQQLKTTIQNYINDMFSQMSKVLLNTVNQQLNRIQSLYEQCLKYQQNIITQKQQVKAQHEQIRAENNAVQKMKKSVQKMLILLDQLQQSSIKDEPSVLREDYYPQLSNRSQNNLPQESYKISDNLSHLTNKASNKRSQEMSSYTSRGQHKKFQRKNNRGILSQKGRQHGNLFQQLYRKGSVLDEMNSNRLANF